jgi:tetratricopeptide (TPR) repeat protein
VAGTYQILFVAGIAAVVAAGVVASRGPDIGAGAGFDLVQLATFVGLAAASWLARRNAALFAMGALPFLVTCVRILGARARWARPARPTWRTVVAGATVLGLAGAAALVATNRFYRWDGRTQEFGLGVLEGSVPVEAAQFIADQRLPGPLYNDLASGGYLAWARPTSEGVYIDGRLEVYDDFYADYRARLADPAAWAVRADELGIRSALLAHRWPNRYALIGWLERSPDWERVYFDEVVMVWVRVRGGEEAIARTRVPFAEAERRTRERLLSAPGGWGYPVARVRALDAYGLLLANLGRAAEAATFFARALEFDLPATEERETCLWLADHHRALGDLAGARRYIERAARAEPHHATVRAAQAWLRDP